MSLPVLFLVTAASVVAYAYAGYPGLVLLFTVRHPRARPAPEPPQWPMITITLPVHNEARVIAATLEQILAADYPTDRRQLLVISDASTDGTDQIVAAFAGRGVELLRLDARRGKTAAENAAGPYVRGSIVVNTDASVRIHPGALKALIAPFSDPSVGVASCADVSVGLDESRGDANLAESRYVGYEMWLRGIETQLASIVGASGCLYAIRTALHREYVPEALSRDFAAALVAWERGYRAVSVSQAICYVPRARSLHREYRRKLRTMTRGLETLWFKRGLLNPFRYGVFSWMLASHKLARWIVPWALVVMLGAGITLARASLLAQWGLGMIGLAIGAAILGWFWPGGVRMPGPIGALAYGLSGQVAALHAWVNVLRGELNPIWEPTRRERPPG
ncbi:MAG TPA: glycosyltransferase [Gemmatimonadales bacterium]|nr:glycosyltransferase [Gemmatimonadales bacterium]